MNKLKDFFRKFGIKVASLINFFKPGTFSSTNFHWRVILVVFLAGALIVSSQSLWIYRSINKDSLDDGKNLLASSTETVTNEMLDKAISKFEKKRELFNKIQSGYFYTADPAK